MPGPLGLCIARWRIVVCTRSRVGDVLAAGPVSSGALPPRDHHTHDFAPQHRGAGGRLVQALRDCTIEWGGAFCRVPRVAGVRSDPASGSSLRVREPGSGDESEQRAGSPDTDFAGHAAQFSPAISALRRSGHSKYRSIDALTRLDLNMSEMERLTSAEITALLTQRKLWTIQDGKLTRQLKFSDFVAAFAFMTKVALVAERMGHHPEWSNVFASVRIQLVSHEIGGLSKHDFELAERIDEFA